MQRNDDEELKDLNSKNAKINYKNGLYYFNKDNKEAYIKAVLYFDKAIEGNPKNSSAYYNKGFALYQLGKREKAEESYESAREQIPEKNAFTYYKQGRALIKLRNNEAYKKAAECFDKAIKLNPKHSEAYYYKGSVLDLLDKREEAKESYQEAINKKHDEELPTNAEIQISNQPSLIFDGDYNEYNSENSEVQLNLSNILPNEGVVVESILIIDHNGENSNAEGNLINILSNEGVLAESILIIIDPNSESTNVNYLGANSSDH